MDRIVGHVVCCDSQPPGSRGQELSGTELFSRERPDLRLVLLTKKTEGAGTYPTCVNSIYFKMILRVIVIGRLLYRRKESIAVRKDTSKRMQKGVTEKFSWRLRILFFFVFNTAELHSPEDTRQLVQFSITCRSISITRTRKWAVNIQ